MFKILQKNIRADCSPQRCAVVSLGRAILGQICFDGVVRDFASKKAGEVGILMIGGRLDDYVPLGDVGFVQLVRTTGFIVFTVTS